MAKLKFSFPSEAHVASFKCWIVEQGRDSFRKLGYGDFVITNRYDPLRHRRMVENDPEGYRKYCRNQRMKQRYGLTQDQWQLLFESQDEKCACCGSTSSGSKKGWHTDHDHLTEEVRGILCAKCNTVLGMLGDTIENVTENCGMYLDYLMKSKGSNDRSE